MVLTNGLAGMVFAGCELSRPFVWMEVLTHIQLMLAASSVTPIPRCLLGGTASACSRPSSEPMHTSTQSVANHICWMSPTRA